MVPDVKVLVVGGGAAGLAAAAELAAQGVDCQLVEAQSRLGGRAHSVARPDGIPFERGAQMVNGDMTSVLTLAAEADLHCTPVPVTGEALCVTKDEVLPRGALISAVELEALLQEQALNWSSPTDIARSVWSLYRWWSTPWEDLGEARRGVRWATSRRSAPARSLSAAMDRLLLCDEDDAIARTMISEQYGAAPEDLDAAALRASLRAYGSERSDLEFHFPAGMGRIIDQLVVKLSRRPILGTPVMRITPEQAGVRVVARGRSFLASRVIVAVPPPVARKVEMQTDANTDVRHLLQAFEAGDLIKTTLVYDRAFWRLKGLSGAASFAEPVGLELVDTSYDIAGDARLTACLGGPVARARAALDRAERDRLLLEDLARVLGPEATQSTRIDEAIWVDDRWSGGGYNATVRQGRCSDAVARLAAYRGPVRFAGAELDDTFAGYVEGAIRSGRRVAQEIAADLREAVE